MRLLFKVPQINCLLPWLHVTKQALSIHFREVQYGTPFWAPGFSYYSSTSLCSCSIISSSMLTSASSSPYPSSASISSLSSSSASRLTYRHLHDQHSRNVLLWCDLQESSRCWTLFHTWYIWWSFCALISCVCLNSFLSCCYGYTVQPSLWSHFQLTWTFYLFMDQNLSESLRPQEYQLLYICWQSLSLVLYDH